MREKRDVTLAYLKSEKNCAILMIARLRVWHIRQINFITGTINAKKDSGEISIRNRMPVRTTSNINETARVDITDIMEIPPKYEALTGRVNTTAPILERSTDNSDTPILLTAVKLFVSGINSAKQAIPRVAQKES